MKPTEKQKKIMDIIIQNLQFWKSTNDIISPSHNSLIEDDVNDAVVYGIIDADEEYLLIDTISSIRYTEIQQISITCFVENYIIIILFRR